MNRCASRGWQVAGGVGFLLGLFISSTPVSAQVSVSIGSSAAASWCDTLTVTSRFVNNGSTLDALWITNQIAQGMYYVTNQTVITLPNGQVLSGSAAEPSIQGGTNLVWDFSGATSDNGIGHLVISEVMYDPSGDANYEDTNEWFEIYNPTAGDISLSGYTVVDALPGQSDALPAATVPAGGYVVVAACTNAFRILYPAFTGTVVEVSDDTIGSGLNNFADGLFLKNSGGTTVDAVSYGGSSAAFSPGVTAVSEGRSIVRNPANADNNRAADWVAGNPPTPGSGTILAGISQGGEVVIVFKVELSCSSASANLRTLARYQQPAGGSVGAASAIHAVTVQGSHLNVFKRPLIQQAGYLDTVTWTVTVENVGFGAASNVELVDSRGPGIQFLGFSHAPTNTAPYGSLTTVVWSAATVPALASLDPGESVSIIVTGRIVACEGLYNTIDARSSCSGLSAAPVGTCFDTTLGGSEGASIEFMYRYASLSGSITPSGTIGLPTCGGKSITLYMTNAAGADVGAALNLYLTPTLPAGYTLSGASYQTNLNRVAMGNLAPGASTNVTLTLLPGGSCPLDTSEKQVLFKAAYQDDCALEYANPTLTMTTVISNTPSASVYKVMPGSTSGTASSLNVNVYFTYQNFSNTAVTLVDQMAYSASYWITNVLGGGTVSGGTNVRWNLTLSGSGVFSGSFSVAWADSCAVAGTRVNRVIASNVTDCVGCSYPVSGSGESYLFTISGSHCSTGTSGTGGCSFAVSEIIPSTAEMCEILTVTTRVSSLSYATNADWNGVVFSNNLGSGQLQLVDTNDIRVLVDGVDYTFAAYIQTGTSLRISFTNFTTAGLAAPSSVASRLDVAWTVSPTNSGQLTDRSSFVLPGCGTVTDSEIVNAGYGMLGIELDALVGQDACGVASGRIVLDQYTLPALSQLTNRTFPVYDVEVVLDLDANRNGQASYSYITNSSSISNFFSLAGSALAGIEPAVTATQLVWSLGDLRTNGVGSLHFRLLGSCAKESGESLRAFVRFNRRCQDGLSPATEIAYSATNTIPSFNDSLVSAYLEPEVAFISGTTYVYRVDFYNSGAATAYNMSSEVAFPANVIFRGAGLSPATTSATNLIWNFQSAVPFGGLVDGDGDGMADDLPPNKLVSIYVTNHISACLPNELRVTVRSGCKDAVCVSATDTATFIPSSPNLASSTTFPSNHILCADGPVLMQIRNSGAGNAYDVVARHVLPQGAAYVPGSARVSIDNGATNAIADPSGSGTSASPLQWDIAQIPELATLLPSQLVKIQYTVYVDCAGVSSTQNYRADASYRDNCGERLTNSSTVATATLGRPVLTITKASRNITRGDASFTTATVPGNPGDLLGYRITIDHGGTSSAEAEYIVLTDVLPDTVAYVGASPAPDAVVGNTLIWSNATLLALVGGGSEYTRAASALTIYVTGTVATCTANVQNRAGINYGCAESCLSMSATSVVYHTFTPSLSPMVGASDGMQLSAAAGLITVTMTNQGGAAASLIITQAAPRGYVITGASISGEYTASDLIVALSGSPAGQTGIVSLTTAAASGATDMNDDLANGIDNLDLSYGDSFTITFRLRSDGSTIDCLADPTDVDWQDPAPDEPSSVSARFGYGARDACDQGQTGSSTLSTIPKIPDPDIDIQPNELLVTNGQVQVFTVTMRNRGEDGNASNLAMRISMGPGWSALAITATSLVQSGSGSVVTEQQGNSNVLVRLTGVVLDPLDDEVVLTLRATANEGAGGLDMIAEVTGDSDNPSIPTCTFTNTFGAAPLANTMSGSVITPVNGEYYAFDQDRTRVAGFSVFKTVRYAGDPPPGVTSLTARVGEDLTYRIEAKFFGLVFSNTVLTESLPANLSFGSPVDAGSSAHLIGQWSYNPVNGNFTLPAVINQDSLFVVDIPVVVSNRLSNQGEVGAQTVFTNEVATSFDVDGITNAPPVTRTEVRVLEPALTITKLAGNAAAVAAGDTVTFTCVVAHAAASATNAYDLTISDRLPAGLTFAGVDPGADGLDNDGDGVADGADAADEASLVDGDTFTITTNNASVLANLPLGSTRTFVFRATVLNQALGSTLVNTGVVTWTSLDAIATNRNERTGLDGAGGLNNYVSSSTATITSRSVTAVSKTLFWTSQTNTVDPDLTIGERVIYQIRVDFPSGMSTNLVIVDNVSTGMDFVGTNPNAGLMVPGAGYRFEIPAGGPVFATNAAQGLVVTDPDATPSSSATADGSGRPITFSIGGITNAPDGNTENDYFNLYMEFVLTTHPTNNGLASAARWTNNAVRLTDTYNTLTATSENYRVVEHNLTVRKTSSITATNLDAGDTLTFSLVVSNQVTYTANAYDIILSDRISNTYFDLSSIAMVETAPGWTFGTITTNPTYTEVRFSSDPGTALAPGQRITNRFSVTLSPESRPNQLYTNRVNILTSDTIDGDSPLGTTGRVRTANSTLVLSNKNLHIAKTLHATSENGPVDSTTTNVQIGEAVVYRLRVSVPEGVVDDLAVTDFLPDGLAYVHGSVSTDVSTLNGTLGELDVSPSGSGLAASGADPVFTFTGTSTINPDNDTNNNHFALYLTAVVLDIPANTGIVEGSVSTFTNLARVTYPGNPRPDATSAAVVISAMEPDLVLGKTIDLASGDAGDALTVTITLTNRGLASAYDLRIEDLVPTNELDPASLEAVLVPEGFTASITGTTSRTVVFASAGGSQPPDSSIEPGELLTFSFTANLAQQVQPGAILTNTARLVAADTINGTPWSGVQRSPAPAPASDTVAIPAPSVAKSLMGTSATGESDTTGTNVTIGETAAYRIAVTLPEGTVSNLTIIDTVPAGYAYVSGTATTDLSAFNGTLPGSPVITAAGTNGASVTVTYPGLAVIANDNNAANNRIDLHLTLRVLDVAANDGVAPALDGDAATALTNRGAVAWSGPSASAVTSAPVVTAVVEPYLGISKSVAPISGLLNRTRIVVTNSGTATAYDLDISDTFMATEWVVSSITGQVGAGYTMSVSRLGDRAVVTVASDPLSAPPANSLEPADFLVITITGQYQEAFSGTAINTARVVVASTLSGSVAGERTYSNLIATAPFGAPDLVATLRGLDENSLPLVCADTIQYRLIVTNAGGSTATGIDSFMLVPTNTTLIEGSIAVNGQATTASGSRPMQVDLPDLAPGAFHTITYRVTVDCGLPLSVTTVYNRATVTWNESMKVEVADNDPSGHDTTVNDGLDDAIDTGTTTYDDDPTILQLSSLSFAVSKDVVIPAGRAASINEAVRFRITVTNNGGVALNSVSLVDTYETTYLTFVSAEPAANDKVNDGVLNWSNLGSLSPGQSRSVLVTFTAKATTPSTRQNNVEAAAVPPAPYPAPANKTDSADYDIQNTTYAAIGGFACRPDGRATELRWETVSEVGTIGFLVWRRDADGVLRPVNAELIPAYGVPQGGIYALHDPATKGAEGYLIEEVEDSGARIMHGPFACGKDMALFDRPVAATEIPRVSLPTLRGSQVAPDGEGTARLHITSAGVYRITFAQLAPVFGVSESDVSAMARADQVELRHRGARVPLFRSPDDTALWFHAGGARSPCDAHDAFLVQSGRNIRLVTDLSAAAVSTLSQADHTVRVESNRIAAMSLVADPGTDYWMWEQIIGGQANANRKTFALNLPPGAIGQGTATLRVRLLGGNSTEAALDHHVRAKVNGTVAGDAWWDGRTFHEAAFAVPASLLRTGTNTVELEGLRDTGVTYTLFYVDALSLTYPRTLATAGQAFALTTPETAAASWTGWNRPGVAVLDITDADRARIATGLRHENDTVTAPSLDAGRTYLLIDPSTAPVAQLAAPGWGHSLLAPTNAADYLLVVADGFEAAAAPLLAHRAAQGLAAAMVRVSDIYEAFGHGVPGPDAIRTFLAYAHRHWTVPPRYVVLAGSGTYDYRDELRYGDNLIPPALVIAPGGLFGSDAPYADVEGDDGLPDFALGRIPANTPAELSAAVAKLIARDADTGSWNNRLLVLNDNKDAGGDFEADAASIAQAMDGRFETTRIDLAALGLANARSATLAAWQSGVGIVNYSGHGALDRFAQEGLLLAADVASLTNSAKAPLVVSMTCIVGRYSVPGYACLGESLLLAPHGGASAVVSPVGLSLNSSAQELNLLLMNALRDMPPARLGDVWMAVARGYALRLNKDMWTIYNMLGDPAQPMP